MRAFEIDAKAIVDAIRTMVPRAKKASPKTRQRRR
jgi:hypothetical protein